MKLQPLGNKVLVEYIVEEEVTKGGIILNSSPKRKVKAKILAVGSGVKIPSPVNVGDLVIVDKYSGQEITLDEINYVIFNADDIIARIDDDKKD